MSIAKDRMASIVGRELAIIVNNKIKNAAVGYINITETRLSKDYMFATIFYTILSDDEHLIELSKKLLSDSKSSIRMELAKKIRDARRIPDLNFKYDKALAYGNRIEEVLKTLK